MPQITLEQKELTNDVSQISMRVKVQENLKHSYELRTKISRTKQGVQSADPSKKN